MMSADGDRNIFQKTLLFGMKQLQVLLFSSSKTKNRRSQQMAGSLYFQNNKISRSNK